MYCCKVKEGKSSVSSECLFVEIKCLKLVFVFCLDLKSVSVSVLFLSYFQTFQDDYFLCSFDSLKLQL